MTEDIPADEDTGLRWWREVLYVMVFYGVYSAIRNEFGSASVSPERAFRHAREIIDAERALGLFQELRIQRWFLDNRAFIQFWNIFYGTFHFLVTAGGMVWMYRRFPRAYPTWRNTLAFTTGLALIGFALYPLMPPRLLCDCPYGSGVDFGFVDTLKVYGGLWSFDSGTMQKVSNQYAAMPSLHFGWSLWCASALAPRARRRWAKALLTAYPAATLFAIVVTANHYWLDAAGGALILVLGYFAGARLAAIVAERRSPTERALHTAGVE